MRNPEEIFHHIRMGQNRVQIASTNANERSSRSHTILVLQYKQLNQDGSQQSARLNLVDLAGSERVKHTGATGATLEEAKSISSNLSSLGRVILALNNGSAHVPFRDSKLTHLLQESLGGNSKTTLICTCSQRQVCQDESITSLGFS